VSERWVHKLERVRTSGSVGSEGRGDGVFGLSFVIHHGVEQLWPLGRGEYGNQAYSVK